MAVATRERKVTAIRSRKPEAYPQEFRDQVNEYASKQGVKPAAIHFQLQKGTVSRWLRIHRQGLAGPGPIRGATKRLMQSNRFTGLPRHEKKKVLAEELLHLAAEIMDRLRSSDTKIFFSQKGDIVEKIVPRPDARDVKDLMVALAVAVDKSTLLAGEATSRHEVVDVTELEKALNEAIRDPEKRRALAVKVLGGMPPVPSDKEPKGLPEHTRVRIPGKSAGRRARVEAGV